MSAQPAGATTDAPSAVDRRRHVVFLVDGLAGGAERFARLVAIHLDPERYRRTLCVTREPLDPADEAHARQELEEAGAELVMLRRRGRADVHPWTSLVRYLRREHVDVLHAHKFGSNVWASLLRTPARVPVVVAHEHTWSYEGQPVRRAFDCHLISRRCDRFVAVTRLDRERMIEIERIDPRKVVVVPVGIPTLTPQGNDVRAELGIPADAPVVTSVAILRPQKALEVLVEAAAKVRERHPAVRVLIVGEGPERPHLERLITSLGLEQTVLLLGRRRDVIDVLQSSDVTVCCSDFEGSPQAVIEYMAAGKPVVATRVGGLPDLVEDGLSGRLVEPRAPHSLADAIEELIADPARATEMGARGLERQRSELTIDATLSRLDSLYSELLDGRA